MSTVTIEIHNGTVMVEPDSPAEIVLELTGGGTLLDAEIVAGLNAASAPSGANAFATLADLPAGYPFPVTVVSNWATPTGCAYDLQQAGIQITRDGVSNIVIAMQTIIAGHYDHAVVSVVSDGVHVPSTTYKVAWNTTPAVGAVVYVTAALQINPATAAELSAHTTGVDPHGDRANTTSQIATHTSAVDPHGDRAYAAGLAVNYDAAGAASTAVSNHTSAVDPHGDRANTTSQIATHAGAVDPHGDRAYAAGLGANYDAAGAASTAVANHASAVDPHGDRANTTSQIATHTSAVDPHGDRANTTSQIATHAGNHTAHGAIVHADVAPVLGAVSGDPTGFTSPENVIVTYDSTARTITLTGTVAAYYKGTLVTALVSGWVSAPHADVVGRYYLYYNGSAFVWATTEWTLDMVQIAAVYYGATNKFSLRECHGLLPWQAHELFHHTIGTFRESGGTLSSYVLASTTAANRRPNVAATAMHDEDNVTTNPALTSKVYTQLRLTGTGTTVYTLSAAEIVPVLVNNPYYNRWDGAAWIQTLMASNSYMCVWLVAIPVTADAGSQAYRYQWLQGQSNGALTTQQALTPADLNLGTLQDEAAEFVFLAKIIIRYTGGNWQLISITDLLGNKWTQVGAPAGAFLAAVTTDATLTGDGTTGNPLSVVRVAVTQRNLTADLTLADGECLIVADYIDPGSYTISLDGDSILEVLA